MGLGNRVHPSVKWWIVPRIVLVLRPSAVHEDGEVLGQRERGFDRVVGAGVYEHRGETGRDSDRRFYACGSFDDEFLVDFGFVDAVFGFQPGKE